jgi:hypothetical protein
VRIASQRQSSLATPRFLRIPCDAALDVFEDRGITRRVLDGKVNTERLGVAKVVRSRRDHAEMAGSVGIDDLVDSREVVQDVLHPVRIRQLWACVVRFPAAMK